MKRIFAVLLMIPVLVSNASANAGPAVIKADPGLELAVDAGSPIVIDKEDLTFDLSGNERSAAPRARVTASYTMTNPSSEPQTVMMAFPYVARLGYEETNADFFRVTDEGVPLDHQVYYGHRIESEGDLINLGFGSILSNVMAESPPEPDDGYVYKLAIDRTTMPDDADRILIRMSLDEPGRGYFTSGFSGGTYNGDGTAELSEWFYPKEDNQYPMSVFVSGERFWKYTISAYESYDSKEPLEGVRISVEAEPSSFHDFVYECFGKDDLYAGLEFGDRTYWALLDELVRLGKSGSFNGVIPLFELYYGTLFAPRLAVGVFYVNFEPNSTKTITVDSFIDPTIKKPTRIYEVSEKYSYAYLTEPAKNWAGFGALNITVIPPDRETVLEESEPALMPDGNGAYTAKLDGLPPENIRFTFSGKKTGFYHILTDDLLIITFIVIISAAMAIVLMRVRRIRKLKSC